MGDTISVKDKGTAEGAIRDLGTLQTTITTLGTDVAAEFDELEQLLNPTVDGETPGIEGVSSVGASLKADADAVSTELGTLATGWRGYVDRLTVIQEDAATTVTQQGGTVDGSFAGVTASGTANVSVTPKAADPSVPKAFSMK